MMRTKTKTPRESLENAAEELNTVMGLKPAIDLDETDQRIKALIQAAGAFVEDGDSYTANTWMLMGYDTQLFERKI